MRLPSILYGQYESVKSSLRSAVRALIRGASLTEAMDASSTLEPAATPGLLLMHGPNPSLGSEAHFHVFAPLRLALEALRAKKRFDEGSEVIFAECLRTSWGALLLMPHEHATWLQPASRHVPFLDAALRDWSAWTNVGERYSPGLATGRSLWGVTNSLHFVLAQRGVSTATLKAPLSAEEIEALIVRARSG